MIRFYIGFFLNCKTDIRILRLSLRQLMALRSFPNYCTAAKNFTISLLSQNQSKITNSLHKKFYFDDTMCTKSQKFLGKCPVSESLHMSLRRDCRHYSLVEIYILSLSKIETLLRRKAWCFMDGNYVLARKREKSDFYRKISCREAIKFVSVYLNK